MTNFTGKMVRVFLLSAIMVMALAGFASAAESEQAIAVGATTGSSLRLREGVPRRAQKPMLRPGGKALSKEKHAGRKRCRRSGKDGRTADDGGGISPSADSG